MKKSLFFLAAAAVALASCSNDEVVSQNTTANQPKEIAFMPLVTPNTRAAVDGTTFPEACNIQVAAWDVTNNRDFFTATTFTHSATLTTERTSPTPPSGNHTIWTGGKYWPLSAAYINFLGYTNFNGTAGSETDGATWNLAGADKAASGVTLVMTDNKTAQKDLMYAIGNGAVTVSGNDLTFPANVPMQFKHAQAWISFYADAYDATSGGKVTLNSITLNGAKYNGTYTITHTNYNASSSQSVAGAWSALGSTANVAVPNWSAATVAYDGSGDGVVVGDGLLIVPDDDGGTGDFTSFTINYTLDGNTYNYTYTPATTNVDQAKHYIYNINFKLHEIYIDAYVTDWADQPATAISIHD